MWRGVVCLGAALLAQPATAELYAERLGEQNLAARRLGGTDAVGGLDDWALGNGAICAVVSDPAHENALSARGGALIDVGHCGRADDQFVLAAPTANFERGVALPVDSVRAEVSDGEARLVLTGRRDGLLFETRYAVGREPSTALRIVTTVERREAGPRFFAFAETLLHPSASLAAFALDTKRAGRSPGFLHPDPDRGPARHRPDLQVLVGDAGVEPGIAYGLQLVAARLERAGGERAPLSHFVSNGESHAMFGVLASPFANASPRSPELASADLGIGDRLVVERRLWVGDRADVASVTDQVFADAPVVSGRVGDAAARIHVLGLDKLGPVTLVRPDPDGRFRVRLPEGLYQLRAVTPGGGERRRRFSVSSGGADLLPLATAPTGRVRLPRGGPRRLVFLGAEHTADPVLRSDGFERRVGPDRFDASAASNDVSLGGLPSDPVQVELPPGDYRVYATRGPEYTVTRAQLRVVAGREQELEIEEPVRALETPGWISADFHVHSALSFDSGLAERLRVASFLAQGAEVMVATEHDRVVDYAPLLRELGAAKEMASVVGVELTSSVRTPVAPHTIGHANAFPLPFRPNLYRGGAPRGEGVRLRDAIAQVRGHGGERVFQVNHPRRASGEVEDGSFFSHLSQGTAYDPTRPLDAGGNALLLETDPASGLRDLDFDAVELMNGESLDYYRVVRADWLSFLLQGERITGTANSDSHRLRSLVGLPRTYVEVADDRVAAFDEAALIAALRAGRAFGTTGPMLDVRLSGAGPGERFQGREGVLRLAVRAAPWVPVSTARVFVNGAPVAERPISAGQTLEHPLAFETDAFVTVEVEGEPDEDYRAVAAGFTPFAFSNPIWVDADGDGRWSAPGLPPVLPAAIADPLGKAGR